MIIVELLHGPDARVIFAFARMYLYILAYATIGLSTPPVNRNALRRRLGARPKGSGRGRCFP
ncbi:hypothetical protein, partial [Sedimentibacter sp. B4]|uniref:hypothetical protein n=1 Tax=Sedimentibacter sp. B4 TaxID=304766 RepID=UPI001E62D0DD